LQELLLYTNRNK